MSNSMLQNPRLTHLREGRRNRVKERLRGIKEPQGLGNGDNRAQRGAMMNGRDANVPIDLSCTILVLDPVARENSSLRVAHNVDLRGIQLGQHVVNKVSQLLRRILNGSQSSKGILLILSVGQRKDTVALLDQHRGKVLPGVKRQEGRMDEDHRAWMGHSELAVVVV